MTTELEIRDLVFAEDCYYKTQRVKIGNKSLITPIKAVDLNKAKTGLNFNSTMRGVNEVYKIYNSSKIGTILSTADREPEINNEIDRTYRKFTQEGELNICFTEFDDLNYPTQKELDYLTDLSHVHSDLTPLPLTPKLSKSVTPENFDKYQNYIKNAIKTIEDLNNKPIMGVLPIPMPSTFLSLLLEFYLKNGINAMCLDFQGSTIGSSKTKIRQLVKELKKQKVLDKSFLYSINLGSGKLSKDKNVVPAKDILSYGYGFDAIGGQHIRKKLSPEILAKLLSNKNIFGNSKRLFNKNDYGYYKTIGNDAITSAYSNDSGIPLASLLNLSKNKDADKIFNQEQQGLEAVKLRTVIREENYLLKYLETKKQVEPNDIKSLSNVKKRNE